VDSGLSLARSGFRFLPNIALADVAFLAKGETLGALFEASARALTEVMVDRRSVSARTQKVIEVTSDTLDGLLYDFLSELIVVKDVDSLLFKTFSVSISKDKTRLTCKAKGGTIDREKNRLRNDVKAVTMNLFGVKRTKGGYEATVVLDI
jgi:SHS2 domain-containing protein